MMPDRVCISTSLLVPIFLSACNLPGVRGTPTVSPNATTAAQTVEAVLTSSGSDLRATGSALQTESVPRTPTAVTPTVDATQEPCDNRAQFIDDITHRDNAQVDPSATFVKIWRLRNDGDCTWTPAYLLSFFGGNRLMAPENVSLSQEVNPGETVDLAVDMKAPSEPGTYQGFWKLRSPEGEYFGIGPQGDQSFWVKIIVPAPPTEPTTPTRTPTSTFSPTATGVPVSPTTTASASPSPSTTPSPSGTASETPTG
jgi:hypothetical protein